MVPYSAYGVALFSSMFQSCNDANINLIEQCTGNFVNPENGLLIPRVWDNVTGSFDDLWSGILNLYEMIMEEGWLERYYAGIQISGYNEELKWPPPSWFNSFYFIIWMLFGFVILRNLFVGVILQTFMTRNGTALLTVC